MSPKETIPDIAHLLSDEGPGALRARLSQTPPVLPLSPRRSDFDLNLQSARVARELIPAAVLIPIIRRSGPTMLFTRRTAHLARHAGQVSFPGGRWQAADSTLVETALRETREETGIKANAISVAGFLDAYETVTGFAILPVVGLLTPEISLRPDPHEVAEIFEVPLDFLLDPANCEKRSREWQGHTREYYAFTHGEHTIWGATAAILVNLREQLSLPDSIS